MRICVLVPFSSVTVSVAILPRCHRRSPSTTRHKNTTGAAAMDALKNALSIVPSGTAATIIVGHALLTKVMICVETNQ